MPSVFGIYDGGRSTAAEQNVPSDSEAAGVARAGAARGHDRRRRQARCGRGPALEAVDASGNRSRQMCLPIKVSS
jgi:hypothetical protein